MELFLPLRKVEEIFQISQNAMDASFSLRGLRKLLGKFTSTIQALLVAKLQIGFLLQIQI